MHDRTPTEGGGPNEYNLEMKKQMGPKNISPSIMAKHKAMAFKAVMAEGFCTNLELGGWAGYTDEKKKLLISSIEEMDDIRYILNVEDDDEVLSLALAKKRELGTLAKMAAMSLPVAAEK